MPEFLILIESQTHELNKRTLAFEDAQVAAQWSRRQKQQFASYLPGFRRATVKIADPTTGKPVLPVFMTCDICPQWKTCKLAFNEFNKDGWCAKLHKVKDKEAIKT